LSEVLQYESLDELRNVVLEKDIENLKRKSHVEQFKMLESKFDIALTKFDSWAKFIESSQRRNLFTHCDGIVSKQYTKICEEVNYKRDKPVSIGDQLTLGGKYFLSTCYTLTEVGVMLGQTLWRKVLPDELEEADKHLHALIFDFLQQENWTKAISLSRFAKNLPKLSSDQMDRINTINYAIALRGIKRKGASVNILSKKDWSASTYDFKLAHAVLSDSYEAAKELMIKIGKTGEIICELSYHDWPLFRDFRDSKEFLDGYESVFGYPYFHKLNELADDAKQEVEEEKEN
jgi:hypothetical protein